MKKLVLAIKVTLITIPVMLLLAIRWFFSVWNTMTVNELLYHLFQPLEGTGDSVVRSFVIYCAIPSFIVWAAVCAVMYLLRDKRRYRVLVGVFAGLLLVFDIAIFLNKIDFIEYVKTTGKGSLFIEDNYIDPAVVSVTFPENKRNLIYIYMESMEVSFSDVKHGGAFEYNIIPELTELAEEGVNFTESSNRLSGAYSLPGTDWTIAGIIAQTSGLPTQAAKGVGFDEGYYTNVVSLGDILEENGYRQYFMCGSDGSFAGRKEYLNAHGDYEVDDFNYAVERGWIEESSRDDWGYPDHKLFEFAKRRLQEISNEEGPFNFSLLTVDTHFSGKICDLCDDQFDNLTENVIACSNRQIVDFVRWCQSQEFYENTTIVLCGDHTSMDSGMGQVIGDDYERRTYTLYLNSPVQPKRTDDRIYTTMDQFPTTIAALGGEIDGNRLGLGTNLFSDTQTLSEQYGIEYEKTELGKYSAFLAKLSGISESSMMNSKETVPKAYSEFQINPEHNEMKISVSDLKGCSRKFFYSLEARYYSDGERESEKRIKLKKKGDIYEAVIPLENCNTKNLDLNVYYMEWFGEEYQIYGQSGDARLKVYDYDQYTEILKDFIDSPDYYVMILATSRNSMNLLNENDISKLRELGLELDMQVGDYCSYCALIHDGKVCEQLDKGRTELSGDFIDNTTYHILSDWRGEASGCRLELDGVNYSSDMSGLWFLVYDCNRRIIADRVCFNFMMDKAYRRVEFELE